MTAAPPPTAISVHVRLRPWKESDGAFTEDDAISLSGSTISVPNPQKLGQRFKYTLDACYGPECNQESIFASVQPIVEQVYKGINATVFAYGVTGSGKTWTMQGSAEDPGVIPRVMESIFTRKATLRKSTLKVSFSYCEVLMEEIYDLLGPRSGLAKKLDVRTNALGENVIPDLSIREISTVTEFEGLYRSASQCRRTAATKLNSSSSRSHAILTIYVETTELAEQRTFMGKICLVDLAGSEDNNLTGNDPTRMRESSAINRSLTTRGSVVEALNSKASRIPYRDSKLTRILQDALGGSSLGMVICNLAPGDKFAKEMLRTLKFATRTREIENKPVTNLKPEATRLQRGSQQREIPGNPVVGGPSRPMLAGGQNSDGVPSAVPSPSDVCLAVRAEVQRSGMTLTDAQLEERIQGIVKQMMLAEATPVNAAPVIAQKVDRDPASDLSQYSEEERKARAKVLINLARGHHDKGELEMSLTYYRRAKVYVPDNQKLARRITEIELASEGQVPIPKRSGVPQGQPIPTRECPSATAPPAPLLASSDLTDNALLARKLDIDKEVAADMSSGLKDNQPTLKRSKALSRPLADITKMVNLASLAAEADSSKEKASKARINVKTSSGRNVLNDSSKSSVDPGQTKKLGVYRDVVTELSDSVPSVGLKARRTAAKITDSRNHQMTLDDSGVTESDLMESVDECFPQDDMLRSIKRRRV